ncbi:MAG: hypothetical protein R2875_12250 [Desulfobacterales bacterium]
MIPVDLTAIAIMVALVVFGILSPREAVMGLAHPAVVTVGAMFVDQPQDDAHRRGGIDRPACYPAFPGEPVSGLILLTVGTASAFINNTPVVILFCSGGHDHVLRVWFEPLPVFDSRLLCLHPRGHLYPYRHLHQYHYQ